MALSSDGNTAIVGGGEVLSVGAVWIYTRTAGVWTQQTAIIPGDVSGSAQIGKSVAISADGNTVAFGGPGDSSSAGATWVYTQSGGSWTEKAKLVGSGASSGAEQGYAVALSGDGSTLLSGGIGDNNVEGAVWVFVQNSGTWSQQAKLVGSNGQSNQGQGFSVALSSDGNTAIFGGPSYDTSYDGVTVFTGSAYVFTRSGVTWSQNSGPLIGTGLSGGAGGFGGSVALSADGTTALIGGPGDGGTIGAAWVFIKSGGSWIQQGEKLAAYDTAGDAEFGTSVALSSDGNTALFGGNVDNSTAGAVWRFTRSGGVWTQAGAKLTGTGLSSNSGFGASVALSSVADTAAVGAPGSGTGALVILTQPPVVTSVSANTGTLAGGANVTITGSHFTTATSVTFGGVAATNVVVVSDTSITATTPAHAAGAVDVAVTSANTGSGTGAGAFTYLAQITAPVVTSLSVASGPAGQNIFIHGSGFTGAVAVKFGSFYAAQFDVQSDTVIFVVAPNGSNTVDIVVIGSSGLSSATSNADKFTFLLPSRVDSISPSSGPDAGGTVVTITGVGFYWSCCASGTSARRPPTALPALIAPSSMTGTSRLSPTTSRLNFRAHHFRAHPEQMLTPSRCLHLLFRSASL